MVVMTDTAKGAALQLYQELIAYCLSSSGERDVLVVPHRPVQLPTDTISLSLHSVSYWSQDGRRYYAQGTWQDLGPTALVGQPVSRRRALADPEQDDYDLLRIQSFPEEENWVRTAGGYYPAPDLVCASPDQALCELLRRVPPSMRPYLLAEASLEARS